MADKATHEDSQLLHVVYSPANAITKTLNALIPNYPPSWLQNLPPPPTIPTRPILRCSIASTAIRWHVQRLSKMRQLQVSLTHYLPLRSSANTTFSPPEASRNCSSFLLIHRDISHLRRLYLPTDTNSSHLISVIPFLLSTDASRLPLRLLRKHYKPKNMIKSVQSLAAPARMSSLTFFFFFRKKKAITTFTRRSLRRRKRLCRRWHPEAL